jgi:hypothetical protein
MHFFITLIACLSICQFVESASISYEANVVSRLGNVLDRSEPGIQVEAAIVPPVDQSALLSMKSTAVPSNLVTPISEVVRPLFTGVPSIIPISTGTTLEVITPLVSKPPQLSLLETSDSSRPVSLIQSLSTTTSPFEISKSSSLDENVSESLDIIPPVNLGESSSALSNSGIKAVNRFAKDSPSIQAPSD